MRFTALIEAPQPSLFLQDAGAGRQQASRSLALRARSAKPATCDTGDTQGMQANGSMQRTWPSATRTASASSASTLSRAPGLPIEGCRHRVPACGQSVSCKAVTAVARMLAPGTRQKVGQLGCSQALDSSLQLSRSPAPVQRRPRVDMLPKNLQHCSRTYVYVQLIPKELIGRVSAAGHRAGSC